MRTSSTLVKEDYSIEAITFDELWELDVPLNFLQGLRVERPGFGPATQAEI